MASHALDGNASLGDEASDEALRHVESLGDLGDGQEPISELSRFHGVCKPPTAARGDTRAKQVSRKGNLQVCIWRVGFVARAEDVSAKRESLRNGVNGEDVLVDHGGTWWWITVELVEGRAARFWPRPGRVFAAAPSHALADRHAAIDTAFAPRIERA